jgi:hypothetical protein
MPKILLAANSARSRKKKKKIKPKLKPKKCQLCPKRKLTPQIWGY